MSQRSEEIVVAARGEIHVAPVGTALPTDPTSVLDPTFVELGYTSRGGVRFQYSQNVEDIEVWQKSTPARRIVTARDLTTSFELSQWNRDTFALAFGGGTWTEPRPGVFRYDPPDDDDAIAEHAMVIDFRDGDRNSRLVIVRGNVSEGVETSLQRGSESLLPITFRALAPDDTDDQPWYFLGDDEAFEAAGS